MGHGWINGASQRKSTDNDRQNDKCYLSKALPQHECAIRFIFVTVTLFVINANVCICIKFPYLRHCRPTYI